MDHGRQNGEVYSNSVSKYFLNANCEFHAYFVFTLALQIYSCWVFCNNMA